jgi:hypothetical protein
MEVRSSAWRSRTLVVWVDKVMVLLLCALPAML